MADDGDSGGYDASAAAYWKNTLAGVSITFAILPTVVFGLRAYASRLVSRRIRPDDILMGCAVVFMWGETVSVLLKAFNGVGVPDEQLSQKQQRLLNLGSWLVIKFWAVSMACVKVSICLFLRHLMWGHDRMRAAFVVVMVLSVCWSCVPFFYTIFFCSPVAFYWDRTIPGGACVDNDKYMAESIISGVLSLITDLVILGLPMPAIWRLNIAFRQKVAVTCILCVGVVVCIFSLLRCVQFAYFDTAHLSTSSNLESLWTILENDFAILCGCLPQLRPLFRRLFDDPRSQPVTPPRHSTFGARGFRKVGVGLSAGIGDTGVTGLSESWTPSENRSAPSSRRGCSEVELEGIHSIDHRAQRPSRTADSHTANSHDRQTDASMV